MRLANNLACDMSKILGFCSAIFALTMTMTHPDPALADPSPSPLTVCSQISDKVAIAVGYYSSGINDKGNVLGGPFVSRGWWVLLPGQCHTFENPFNARYMFWWGVGNGLNDSILVVASITADTPESVHFCVPNYFNGEKSAFVFEDENASSSTCQKVETRIWVTPQQVDTFVESTVNITESMVTK